MDLHDYKLQKENSEDLYCWFRARKNLISLLLEKTCPQNNNINILDIGCGTGTELEILKKFGEVSALDINKEALSLAQEKDIKIILGNIENYDIGQEKYSHVCAFDILEHLQKDSLVLEKIYAALKKGGFFIFTVPAFPFLFSEHDIALEHKRRYTKKEIITKLKKANFSIEKTGYWNSILFPMIASLRIGKILIAKIRKNLKNKPETSELNGPANEILFQILNFENKLIENNINIPYGLSIYGIARK